MSPAELEFIAPLIAVLFIGSGALLGFRMWLHRPQRSKTLPEGDEQRLAESVELLHEQVRQLRGDMTDLHERVDFAERLLVKGKED